MYQWSWNSTNVYDNWYGCRQQRPVYGGVGKTLCLEERRGCGIQKKKCIPVRPMMYLNRKTLCLEERRGCGIQKKTCTCIPVWPKMHLHNENVTPCLSNNRIINRKTLCLEERRGCGIQKKKCIPVRPMMYLNRKTLCLEERSGCGIQKKTCTCIPVWPKMHSQNENVTPCLSDNRIINRKTLCLEERRGCGIQKKKCIPVWPKMNLHKKNVTPRLSANTIIKRAAPASRRWLKPFLIALTVLVLLVIGGTLTYTYSSNTQAATATCQGLAGFWPCGTAAGDAATVTSATDRVEYTTDATITYNLLGATTTNPVVLKFLCHTGYVSLDGNDIVRGGPAIVDVPGSRLPGNGQYDVPDAAKNQYCFHRKAAYADLAAIDCLISGFVPTEGYVFTWLKSSFNGNNVGSFQVVVAFATGATHVISNYHSDLESSGTVDNGQFHTHNGPSGTEYETATTVVDVIGKRTAFALHININLGTDQDLADSTRSSATCPY